jgi:hypothetical protein
MDQASVFVLRALNVIDTATRVFCQVLAIQKLQRLVMVARMRDVFCIHQADITLVNVQLQRKDIPLRIFAVSLLQFTLNMYTTR